MITLDQLRSLPIDGIAALLFRDYWQKKEQYQKGAISRITLDQTHALATEPLAACEEFDLLAENYYWQSPLLKGNALAQPYLARNVFLRRSILTTLAKADRFLRRFGLRLKILSGYRHPQLQQMIIEQVKQKAGARVASQLLAQPQYHLPHATGAAVDLEVWDEKQNRLLPTKTRRGDERAILEKGNPLKPEERETRDNRRLIHNLLTKPLVLAEAELFIPHPFEYWHYGRNEKLSAFFGPQGHPVFYDQLT